MVQVGSRFPKNRLGQRRSWSARIWLLVTWICVVTSCALLSWFISSKEDVASQFTTLENSVSPVQSSFMSPLSKNPARERILGLPSPPPERYCPCCNWSGTSFAKHKQTLDRRCPICGAFERHRKFCALLACHEDHGGFQFQRQEPSKPFKLLHFGAERHMYDLLDQLEPKIEQFGLDFFSPGYKYNTNIVHHADVTNLKDFADATADGVIILHVLEHVRDLDAALGEIRRVLKPASGWAYIEVPCYDLDGGKSKDCRNLTTREELHQCAGQHDHVWRYDCQDFEQSLKGNGLLCQTILQDLHVQSQCLSPSIHRSLGLHRMPSYLCHTSNTST